MAGSLMVGMLCLGAGATAWAAIAIATPPTSPAKPARVVSKSAIATARPPAAIAATKAANSVARPVVHVSLRCAFGACAPGPRGAEVVAAAVKAGDVRAVVMAGGSAQDVMQAVIARDSFGVLDVAEAMIPDGAGNDNQGSIIQHSKLDTARFVVASTGTLGVSLDLDSGGYLSVAPADLAGLTIPPDIPSAVELNNQRTGLPPGTLTATRGSMMGADGVISRALTGYLAPWGFVPVNAVAGLAQPPSLVVG